jgi:hypothetical protein
LSSANYSLSLASTNDGLRFSAGTNDCLSLACANYSLRLTSTNDGLHVTRANNRLCLSSANYSLSLASTNDGLRLACANNRPHLAGTNYGLSLTGANHGLGLACANNRLHLAGTNYGLSLTGANHGLGLACANNRPGLSGTNHSLCLSTRTNNCLSLASTNDCGCQENATSSGSRSTKFCNLSNRGNAEGWRRQQCGVVDICSANAQATHLLRYGSYYPFEIERISTGGKVGQVLHRDT